MSELEKIINEAFQNKESVSTNTSGPIKDAVNLTLEKLDNGELRVCEKISDFLKENFVDDLTYFEKKNKMTIDIISDPTLIIPEYIINIQNKSKKTIELIQHFEKLKNLEIQIKEDKITDNKEAKKFHKKPFKKKPYFKKKFVKKTTTI